jgi:hypothetical protein
MSVSSGAIDMEFNELLTLALMLSPGLLLSILVLAAFAAGG